MPATILVCDDEPSLRELMRVSLDDRYRFVEAADAEEAVAVAERVQPALVLLDVMMPGGSGLAVLSHLRAHDRLRNVPVVIISAYRSEADRSAALAAGADAFVGKPFDPDRLAAVVEDLLRRAG